jgi:hypothetical protein
VDAPEKAQVLLFVRNREPVLDELDARAHQHLLELGHVTEKFLHIVFRAKTHDALDAGAVVPAAVEQHHLAGGRQVRHVALEIPLRALAVVGRGQRRHAAHARVQALGDALDHAALAGLHRALEEDHHLVAGGHHPVLQLDQLALQAKQLAEIVAPVLAVQREVGRGVARQRGDRAVFQLQLQLFVVAVEQVAVNAAIRASSLALRGISGAFRGSLMVAEV